MFMFANVGEGIISVLSPVYATSVLHGNAFTLGLMLSAAAAGGIIGSFLVGAISWRWTLGRSIAAAELLGGLAFMGLLAIPQLLGTLAVLGSAFLLLSPLTIWAQTIRMRLIPSQMRGRVFSMLRTLMQSAPPIGAIIGAGVLTSAGIPATILIVALTIAIPGAIGLVHPALSHKETISSRNETSS
jgi:predicted MFS family arabinose efflux permease